MRYAPGAIYADWNIYVWCLMKNLSYFDIFNVWKLSYINKKYVCSMEGVILQYLGGIWILYVTCEWTKKSKK